MVAFREVTKDDEKYLVVVHNPDDVDQGGFKLAVHPSLCGSRSAGLTHSADNKPLYRDVKRSDGHKEYLLCNIDRSGTQRESTFTTLGRRIIEGEVKWGIVLKTSGAFGFVERYWEWCEDVLSRSRSILKRTGMYDAVSASLYTYSKCPSVIRAFCEAWCPETNTIHTEIGEMSISLADLWHIGGLPVNGEPYEEVILSLEELSGPNTHQRAPSLPVSCQHLFAAYLHCLDDIQNCENPKVLISRWIEFWCKKSVVYKKPSQEKRTGYRPKDTQNPSGHIPEKVRPWSQKDEQLFTLLHIGENSKDESFLAAFIACWLCLFAFPSHGGVIRPSTFKMASLIAQGSTCCLAVPVLANIYKGMNMITYSSVPERGDAYLPWHYIIGWIACYFGTHHKVPSYLPGPAMVFYSGVGGAKNINDIDGRILIHEARNVIWWASILRRDRTEFITDNNSLSPRDQVLLISVRSSFLVFHEDGTCIAEPYAPYRFARQFGFFQVIPRELPGDDRCVALDVGRQLWEKYFTSTTGLRMVLPETPRLYDRHTSFNFGLWWSKVHGTYLSDKRSSLIATVSRSNPKALVATVDESHPKALTSKGGKSNPKASDGSNPKALTAKVDSNHPKSIISKTGGSTQKTKAAEADGNHPKIIPPTTVVKIKNVELPKPSMEPIPYDPQHILKEVGKGKTIHANSKENRRLDMMVTSSGSTSHGDRNPKRRRTEPKTQLDDVPLYVEDVPQRSEDSASGPDAFSLAASKFEKKYIPPIEAAVGRSILPKYHPCEESHTDENIMIDVNATVESNTQLVEDAIDVEDDDGSFQTPLAREGHFAPKCATPLPQRGEVSEFRTKDVISKCRQRFLESLWESIGDRLSHCDIDKLGTTKRGVYEIFSEMERTEAMDLSHLRRLLDTLFRNASRYQSALDEASKRPSEEEHAMKISLLYKKLSKAETAEKAHFEKSQSLKVRSSEIQNIREELQRKLDALQNEDVDIAMFFRNFDVELQGLSARVSQLKEEINALESIGPLPQGDADALKGLEGLLEGNRNAVKNLQLFS